MCLPEATLLNDIQLPDTSYVKTNKDILKYVTELYEVIDYKNMDLAVLRDYYNECIKESKIR